MTDVDFQPAPAANLMQIAADEVAAFRLVNGEPRLADLDHLMARVRVLVEPIGDQEITKAILQATGRK